MNTESRSIGQSLLAMMVLLVALLMLMMALSLVLRAEFADAREGSAMLVGGLMVFGIAYAALAWGLWQSKQWCWGTSLALLPLVTVSGLLEFGRNEVLDLGTMLILLLTFLTNLVVIMALFLRRRMQAQKNAG